jgi:hypothetical protein
MPTFVKNLLYDVLNLLLDSIVAFFRIWLKQINSILIYKNYHSTLSKGRTIVFIGDALMELPICIKKQKTDKAQKSL